MKFIILNVQIHNSSFTSIKQGPRPTIQGKSPLWAEVVIDARTPSMNYRNLCSKWNAIYVHSNVQHSAISTGYECLLEYKVPIITNVLEIKIIINYVLSVHEFC
jgi:hypothetical protein